MDSDASYDSEVEVASSSDEEVVFNRYGHGSAQKGALGFVKATEKPKPSRTDESDGDDNDLTEEEGFTKRGGGIHADGDELDEDFGAFEDPDEYRPSFGKPRKQDDDAEYRPSFSKTHGTGANPYGGMFTKASTNMPLQPLSEQSNSSQTGKDEFGRDVGPTGPGTSDERSSANHKMKELMKRQLAGVIRKSTPPEPRQNVAASPSPLPEDTTANNEADKWKKAGFSKMAIRFMLKHSATGRLGKDEQGIAAPIEAMARPERAGLGMVEEASSLQTNKANTEHLERMRAAAQEDEAREREFFQEQMRQERIWRKKAYLDSEGSCLDTATLQTVREDKLGEQILHGTSSALLVWRERIDALQRQIDVDRAMRDAKLGEVQRMASETKHLRSKVENINIVSQCLDPLKGENALRNLELLESCLRDLYSKIGGNEWEELNLDSIPGIILRQVIKRFWDIDQDVCLDVCECLMKFEWSKPLVISTLMKIVVPRLNKIAEEYRLESSAPLHLTIFPWLIYITPAALESALEAPVKALEREIGRAWNDLDNVNELKTLTSTWKAVCGGSEFEQELVARALGQKLFAKGDIPLIKKYYDHGLLSLEDFACASEGALQTFVRPGSEFRSALDSLQIAKAARMYQAVKSLFPIESIADSCCQGRIRHLFQYALEHIAKAMGVGGDQPIDIGISNAIEPKPRTFAEAWYRNRVETAKLVEVAPDYSAVATLQQTVEDLAEAQGKMLIIHPQGRLVDGKKVYVLGSVYCYFDRGVAFASRTMKDWRPVSVEQLLEMG